MFVGVARLTLHLPGARSLKDKRAVVRSFKDRTLARFKISIAEIGALDAHQRAIFGLAVVSNDPAICDEIMASVVASASGLREALLTDVSTEIVSFADEGKGVGAGRGVRNDLERGPAADSDNDDEDGEGVNGDKDDNRP